MRHVTSIVLALLVAGSLLLAARLWAPDRTVHAPLAGAYRYPIPGTVAGLTTGDLAQPWRMIVHFGAARSAVLADPGDPHYISVWADTLAVLPDLGPSSAPATLKVAEGCAALAQQAPYSLELALGERLSWSTWASLWGLGATGSSPSSASPPVDRLLIVPAVPASGRSPAAALGATICRYVGTDAARYSVAPNPAMGNLTRELAALRSLPLDYDVVPLPPVAGLGLRPGIDVPVPGFARGSVKVQPETISPRHMLAALFPPTASVRRTTGLDGLQNYSDGLADLHLGGGGSLQYAVGAPPTVDPEAPGQALLAAASFVDQAGGWPPTGVLFDLAAIPQPGSFSLHGGEAAHSGYRITFTERWRGLPLLADPPPIAIDVGAPGVLAYTRQVSVPEQEQPAQPFLPAARALADLAAAWPLAASGSDRIVVDVFPAYLPSGDGKLWLPVWGVELQDGSIVALSATTGATLDVLRPQGG